MKNAYIKFKSQEDSVKGFNELVAHASCAYLSNEIYCVPWNSLAMLDKSAIQYSLVSDDALTGAHPIWNVKTPLKAGA